MNKKKLEFTEAENIALSESIRKKALFIHELDQEAPLVEYFFRQIDGSTVAHRLRQTLELASGTLYAILPEGLEPHHVENWSWGKTGLGYPTDPHGVLDDIVRRFLTDVSCRVLTQDSSMSVPEVDPADAENLVVLGDELYWEVPGPVADSFVITSSVPLGHHPTVLYFYRSIRANRKTIDDTAIAEIVDNLIGLVVGALDEDTYLIWWRTDREPFPGSALAIMR